MIDHKSSDGKSISTIVKSIYTPIQAAANIAVVVALLFTFWQYTATIKPTRQEQRLVKAQALCNSGQFTEAIQKYNSFLLKDHPIALNNLGYMYEKGLEVRQDIEKAKSYYRRAAAEGSELATNNLIRLDVMDFSEEAQEELINIFRSAYEMKNEKILRAALSLIDVKFDDEETIDSWSSVQKYGKLFDNDAGEYRSRLLEKGKIINENRWTLVDTFYADTSQKSYTGSDSKMVFEGAIAQREGDLVGIRYKYSLYKRERWALDGLEYGIEKVYSID